MEIKKTKRGRQGEGGGRKPVVFDSKQIQEVETLAQYLSKKHLSDHMGIDDNTFREIEKRQPEVAQAYARGRSNSVLGVSKGLILQAMDGNINAGKFFLETQAGWQVKTETQVSFTDELKNLAGRLPD